MMGAGLAAPGGSDDELRQTRAAGRRVRRPLPLPVSRGYANYVLFVLTLVYVFNFIDRQILSILAEDIKRDLGLADAQIGFLYGTAFAVFYAIFGIPLGRLADIWVRKSLISVGLFFWSLMTALSGTARGFGSLAGFRIGVGVGESSASPAAFSMLGDYFPPRLRATAVAIYSSGVYIGAGSRPLPRRAHRRQLERRRTPAGGAPFGLAGWQAAFFAVGLPGILMALWVRTLREPVRGQSEGLAVPPTHPHPFRELFRELGAVLPPLTLWTLAKNGAGARGILINLALAAVCAGGAWTLISILGSAPQWIAMGIGLYAFFSWLQGIALRDRATFSMIYRSKAIVYGEIGFAWLAFVGYGFNFWTPPFFQRVHGVSVQQAGIVLGLSGALAGLLGVSGGGMLSDRLRRTRPRGAARGGHDHGAGLRSARAADDAVRQRGRRLRLQLHLPALLAVLDRLGDRARQRAGDAAHASDGVGVLHPRRHLHRPGARPLHHGPDQRPAGEGGALERRCAGRGDAVGTPSLRPGVPFPVARQPSRRARRGEPARSGAGVGRAGLASAPAVPLALFAAMIPASRRFSR